METPLLRRQLARLGLSEETPPTASSWRAFLDRVRATYREAEQDRYTLERSLMISSREMHELTSALQENELRFRRLFESGILGIAIAEADGRFSEANGAFLAMLGYAPEDVTTGTLGWEKVTAPEWRHVHPGVGDALGAVGHSRPWEKQYLRKDGSRVHVLVGVASLGEGRSIAFAVDLSEQKRAELEQKKAEEARAALEEQLRQAQKLEALGILAGGVAHDFNNLLSVILSYGQVLAERFPEGDPTRVEIDEIYHAGQRAADLTRQLLAFSRRQMLQPALVDLNDVVLGMLRMLRRLLGEDIVLSFQPSARRAVAFVDPGQIEQVIMNLAVNARDAMPEGGRLVLETKVVHADSGTDDVHSLVASGDYVELCVTDTGTGMDPATLGRIFDPFFTTKGQGRGTGLGLATVLGIVKQSQGHIFVASEPGRGSVFRVRLPLATAADGEVRPSRAPKKAQGGTETILLVEDDRQVRTVASTILRTRGYRVVEAASAADAIGVSEGLAGAIDLLLTDVVMPGMNGRQLAEHLLRARPATKVLFMSGYSDDAVLRRGLSRAEVCFLQKPLTPESLLIKVREALT